MVLRIGWRNIGEDSSRIRLREEAKVVHHESVVLYLVGALMHVASLQL